MSKVRCWCCEYYILIDNPYAVNSAILIGTGYNNEAELKIAKFA